MGCQNVYQTQIAFIMRCKMLKAEDAAEEQLHFGATSKICAKVLCESSRSTWEKRSLSAKNTSNK